MAAATPQPNFPAIHQALVGLANEIILFPNLPAMDHIQMAQNVQRLQQDVAQNTADIAQINENINQINENINQMNQNMAQMNVTLARINQRLQNTEDLLPIRLYNATCCLQSPLRYPPAVVIVPPIPRTKSALLDLTVAQCNMVAGALGLPHLGPGVTVAECQLQISDYLGCAMIFDQ